MSYPILAFIITVVAWTVLIVVDTFLPRWRERWKSLRSGH